jgi:stearoyl-CoA desaturase (delta-9 desaturase)
MQPSTKLKYFQIATHAIAIVAIPYGIYQEMWSWFGWALLVYFVVGVLGTTIGYHRMLAHNSFETYAPIRYLLIFCGMLCSVSSPLTSVLVHRTHHKHTDRARDPHSPSVMGYKGTWFGDWMGIDLKLDLRTARKELKDPFFKFTHQHYATILLLFVVMLALVDWKVAVYLYCVPALFFYHYKGFSNVFGHSWGYRSFDTDEDSRNCWPMHILSFGDGWHNNHHKYPGRWNTQIRWWELDPAAWIIWLIKKPT